MKFHKQLNFHKPDEGVYGDCQRTVLACLLDKDSPEEVPNFAEKYFNDLDGWRRSISDYLATQGYCLVEYAFNCDLETLLNIHKDEYCDLYYLVSGTSKNGCDHVVIAKGNQIIWDPAKDDSGIVGPGSDGLHWVGHLISTRFCA